MLEKLYKILKREVSNWLRDLAYTVALLETIFVVIYYFRPDFLFKILMWP